MGLAGDCPPRHHQHLTVPAPTGGPMKLCTPADKTSMVFADTVGRTVITSVEDFAAAM